MKIHLRIAETNAGKIKGPWGRELVRATGEKTRRMLACCLGAVGEIQVTTREVVKWNEEIGGRADDCTMSIVADQTQKAECDAGRSDEFGKVDGGGYGYGMDRAVKIALDSAARQSAEAHICQTFWVGNWQGTGNGFAGNVGCWTRRSRGGWFIW